MKSKLNGGNLVYGVNTWAVSVLRYSAASVSWRKSELQGTDRKNRKLFTYLEHYTLSHMQTLYIHRKKGGRVLIFIEDCVELPIRGLEMHVYGSEETLI